jgi:hypothetical protein
MSELRASERIGICFKGPFPYLYIVKKLPKSAYCLFSLPFFCGFRLINIYSKFTVIIIMIIDSDSFIIANSRT